MSDSHSSDSIFNAVLENLKNLPSSQESHFFSGDGSSSTASSSGYRRLFGRQKPVHELLGGGHSADVLLWRKKHLSAGFLAGATLIWALFQWIGFHFVSLVSIALLVIVGALFAWSNATAFLNRAPPPIPKLELSDEQVVKAARVLKVEINRILSTLHDIAIGRDVKRFAKLAGGLTLLVLFGGWFHFLTLFYLAVVAAHTLPVLYEKNEDTIDSIVQRGLDELHNQYKKVDASLLSKIPRAPSPQKKSQ